MHTIDVAGARIPALGLGTWELRGDAAREMVRSAIEIGYRHVDTAIRYGNEAAVGAGIRDSGIERASLFLTTKVWPNDFEPAAFRAAVEGSLARLGAEYVDLLLLHWPSPDHPLAETLEALDAARRDGLTRHIGVSNFTVALLDEAAAASRHPLSVNQVEYHPYLDQSKLLAAHARHGIAATAYCPLARGRVFGDPRLQAIGTAHGKTPGQVALRWLVQQPGVGAIPRTSNPANARANLEVFDFSLSEAEVAAVSALASPDGRITVRNGEGFAPVWD